MKKQKLKIAVIARTIGLDYDDRIRKECISIANNAEVKIFVTFENNAEEEGITSYGIPYKSFKLKTRESLSSGSFLILKAFEFYLRVKPYLKNYDLVWAHEEYSFMFPLFLRKNTFIWDLHEIPSYFTRGLAKVIFWYIERKSKFIIHANEFRINYLKERGLVKFPQKHDYIRNYPDKIFSYSQIRPKDFFLIEEWLDGSKYVYLQGLTITDRYPYNSIAAILEATDFKIIVIGTFEDLDAYSKLSNDYNDEFSRRVYFVGRVNQLAIPSLLKNSEFSMIFYDISDPNNEFCEANRFFQAINLGVPVITGINPSMSSLVKLYKLGVALDTDGRDKLEVIKGINKLLSRYSFYKQNCLNNVDTFIWNDNNVKKTWYIN